MNTRAAAAAIALSDSFDFQGSQLSPVREDTSPSPPQKAPRKPSPPQPKMKKSAAVVVAKEKEKVIEQPVIKVRG